jgi:hypothetical protein
MGPDLDLTPVECGFVHDLSSLLSVFFVAELDESEATRVALLIEVDMRVQDWTVLFEGVPQLLAVYAVWEVANVEGKSVRDALVFVKALNLFSALLDFQHFRVLLGFTAFTAMARSAISFAREASRAAS